MFIAREHFSYSVLCSQLTHILKDFFGSDIDELLTGTSPTFNTVCLDFISLMNGENMVHIENDEVAVCEIA